ncbi:potassium-transporting ATPase subunit F [Peribacillus psychrosaccharolyticus]
MLYLVHALLNPEKY